MTIKLKPRGTPDPGAQWSDPGPHEVIVVRETPDNWIGYPANNPACPNLHWPKYAWEIVVG